MSNPYEILGVAQNATAEEIKRAYRRKAKECHPDLNPGDPTANERMQRVNEAYDRLTHPEKYRAQFRPESARRSAENPYGGAQSAYRPYGNYTYTYYYAGPEWQDRRRANDRRVENAVAHPFRGILRAVGYIILFRFIISLLRFGFFGFF